MIAMGPGHRGERSIPFSKGMFEVVHEPEQAVVVSRSAATGDAAGIKILFDQVFVLLNNAIRIFSPVCLFEYVIGFFPIGNQLSAGCIIPIVVEIEFVGGQQGGKDVLVGFDDIRNDAVCFVDEVAGRLGAATSRVDVEAATTFEILEDFECTWVPEELAKETNDAGVRCDARRDFIAASPGRAAQ